MGGRYRRLSTGSEDRCLRGRLARSAGVGDPLGLRAQIGQCGQDVRSASPSFCTLSVFRPLPALAEP